MRKEEQPIVEPREWLIRKGGMYYRPNRAGYTTRKAEAGRYTQSEAEREARIEPWHMSALYEGAVPDDQIPSSAAERLAAFFRDEAMSDGFEGDVEGASPVETAIKVMRRDARRIEALQAEIERLRGERDYWKTEAKGESAKKDYRDKLLTATESEASALRKRVEELEEARGDLLAVAKAALAFIDCHVADPDITEEMVSAYNRLKLLEPHDVIAKAEGGNNAG